MKAQLFVALDAGLIDQAKFEDLYKLTTETGNLIGGFIRYLNKGRDA